MIAKTLESEKNSVDASDEVEKVPKDVLLIAQQIKIARSLASNDLRQRTKQLKKLKKWFNLRANSSYPFSDDDFLRVWKGLYYCMWMSDKPLVQEGLAEDFGSLLPCFGKPEVSAQFFGAFLKTMSLEWFGIDQWRIDKFLMLVRRMLRHAFQVLKDAKWKKKFLLAFGRQLKCTVLGDHEAIGLTMHFIDIYLDELAKIADGEISADNVVLLLKPFVKFLAKQDDQKLLAHTRRSIFYKFLWQSDMGREFSEKFNAWKEMGFPTENINDLEKVEDIDEEEASEDEEIEDAQEADVDSSEQKLLDPRAGCVDVVIPELPVDVQPFIDEIEKLQFDDITNRKSRKVMREILQKFKTFQTGEFPLGVKKMPRAKLQPLESLVEEKVKELDKFEDELMSTTRQLKQMSKKKRRKILQSIDLSDGTVNEDNFEQILAEAIPSKKRKLSVSTDDDSWKEEDTDALFLKDEGPNKKKKTAKKNLNKKQEKLNALKESEGSSSLKQKKKKQRKETEESNTSPLDEIEKNLLKKQKKKNKAARMNAKKSPEKSDSTKSVALNSDSEGNTSVEKSTPQKGKGIKHSSKSNSPKSEWDKPLQEGEIEYFLPSRKNKLKEANDSLQQNDIENSSQGSNLVLNPFAKKKAEKKLAKTQLLGKGLKKAQSLKNIHSATSTPSSSAKKRVKIVLQKNRAQKPSEYRRQVLNSPQVPYDAEKKPTKSLLKPNLMPSPINPFYKKKIGLKINDTL